MVVRAGIWLVVATAFLTRDDGVGEATDGPAFRFQVPAPYVTFSSPGTRVGLSPDGGTLGFLTDDRLKRISPLGDGLLTICEATSALRGQWTADDTIYFSANTGRTLQRVSAEGYAVLRFSSCGYHSCMVRSRRPW